MYGTFAVRVVLMKPSKSICKNQRFLVYFCNRYDMIPLRRDNVQFAVCDVFHAVKVEMSRQM